MRQNLEIRSEQPVHSIFSISFARYIDLLVNRIAFCTWMCVSSRAQLHMYVYVYIYHYPRATGFTRSTRDLSQLSPFTSHVRWRRRASPVHRVSARYNILAEVAIPLSSEERIKPGFGASPNTPIFMKSFFMYVHTYMSYIVL